MRCCISVAHTIKPISPHFKASTACGGGGISLCEMTEGADVTCFAAFWIATENPCIISFDRGKPCHYIKTYKFHCRGNRKGCPYDN